MTRKQFLEAADRGRPVRLKDRSRCFYEDEWYRPCTGPDGRLAIAAHTGEQHEVDGALLDNLTDEVPPLTVADVLHAAHPGDEARTLLVIADPDGKLKAPSAYDVEPTSITITNGDLRQAAPREPGTQAVLLRVGATRPPHPEWGPG